MLRIGETSTVKFNVDVHGSGVTPEVRVVLNLADHELGFKCTKVGDEWQADIKIPVGTEPGMYDLRVEVSINNRLFTPVKRQVEVGNDVSVSVAEKPAETTPPPTPQPPPAPTPVPEPAILPKPPISTVVPEVKKVEPKPVPKPAPKPVVKPGESLMKQVVPEAKAPPVIRKEPQKPTPIKVAPVPPKKVEVVKKPSPPLVIPKQPELRGEIKIERRVAPRPVKTQVKETAPIRISMAEIAEDASKKFDNVLRESKSYSKPTVTVKAFEMAPAVPVKLVKGDIVYE